jgi:lysine 2,3-aminomutase
MPDPPFFAQLIPPLLDRLVKQGCEAIARQFVISPKESLISPDDLADPIGDAVHSPLPGIVRRYTNRVLLKPFMACAVHCRFCFRREAMGNSGRLSADLLANALAYIAREREIFEVILTGGDPLMLSPSELGRIVQAIEEMPHVQIIRLHTRLPIAAPERLNAGMLAALACAKPIFIAIHCNHADELTPEAQAAITKLDKAGFPLLSQTVLLAGVNDDPHILATLMRALLSLKVKPYYLHQCDKARGNAHFRVPLARGQEIISDLRNLVPGIGMPSYMLDIPGGNGKVPVGPCHWDGKGKIYDHQGKATRY